MAGLSMCAVVWCNRPVRARRLCKMHYDQDRQAQPPIRRQAQSPIRRCGVDGCDRPHDAKGLCKMHYKRWRKYGGTDLLLRSGRLSHGARNPKPGPCLIDGCTNAGAVDDNAYCAMHHLRRYTGQSVWPEQAFTDPTSTTPCDVATCQRTASLRGLCVRHYREWRANATHDELNHWPHRPYDDRHG